MGRRTKNKASEAALVSTSGEIRRGNPMPALLRRSIDRGLAVQRPVVLRSLRKIVVAHPESTPAELVSAIERRYLTAVTVSGAGVGATAVVPAIGTITTLALSGVDTVAFLEATALFAQSLSEVHGFAVDDPVRARAMVLAMMLGDDGSAAVRQFAAEIAHEGSDHPEYWGNIVAESLPSPLLLPLIDQLKRAALRRFAVAGSTSVVARAIPFGIGAVVGGTANNVVGRRVVHTSHRAFGDAPSTVPEHLTRAQDRSTLPATV